MERSAGAIKGEDADDDKDLLPVNRIRNAQIWVAHSSKESDSNAVIQISQQSACSVSEVVVHGENAKISC